MWRPVVFLALFCGFVCVLRAGDIGEGKWTVLDVKLCDNPEQYEMTIECSRSKMNRTHDAFNALIKLKKTINDKDFAIAIDVHKEVDGGFKFYQKLTDESFCNFSRKYAKGNMEKALTMANVDPPDCPIAPGSYEVNGFIFNYDELPDKSIYGVFEVYAYVIENMHKVGCICMVLEFKKIDDCDEDDYED